MTRYPRSSSSFFKVVELVKATNGSKLVTRVPWENNAKKVYSFQLLIR